MGKKRPVKPSELWGNEGIKQTLTQTHQQCKKCTYLMIKNAFLGNKKRFSLSKLSMYTRTYVRLWMIRS